MMNNCFHGKTILIADDSTINRRLLQNLLQRNGYKTIIANGGYECLEKVRRHRPDMVLLDIMMPDISGIDVGKTLQKETDISSIPIIFVTAATDDATLSKAFEAGGSDYVRKPVNKVELLKRIQSVFLQQNYAEKKKEEEKLLCALSMGGTICHELNQPLQYISGMTQLLLMDLQRDSKEYHTVEKMYAQIKRMDEIINKLRKINTIETRYYPGDTKIIKIGS